MRSVLAAHNSRVADAIHPDNLKLHPPSYITDAHYVFVAIDTEFDAAGIVSELGYATIDTADIVNQIPGPKGKGWFHLIKASHFALLNENVVRHALPFNFGPGEAVTVEDASRYVRKTIARWHKAGRRVVIVGHGVLGDINHLRFNFGFNIANLSGVVGLLDTHAITFNSKMNAGTKLRTLYDGLNDGEEGFNFHNAGNDAVYSLRVMLMLAMTPQRAWPRRPIENVVLPPRTDLVDPVRRAWLNDRVILPLREVATEPFRRPDPAMHTTSWVRNLWVGLPDMLTAIWRRVRRWSNSTSLTKLQSMKRQELRSGSDTEATSDYLQHLLETVQDTETAAWQEIRLSKEFKSLTSEQQTEVRLRRASRNDLEWRVQQMKRTQKQRVPPKAPKRERPLNLFLQRPRTMPLTEWVRKKLYAAMESLVVWIGNLKRSVGNMDREAWLESRREASMPKVDSTRSRKRGIGPAFLKTSEKYRRNRFRRAHIETGENLLTTIPSQVFRSIRWTMLSSVMWFLSRLRKALKRLRDTFKRPQKKWKQLRRG